MPVMCTTIVAPRRGAQLPAKVDLPTRFIQSAPMLGNQYDQDALLQEYLNRTKLAATQDAVLLARGQSL